MSDNIVLIGMPGVGKSTAGVILAKLLGYKFIDADLLIQEREGRLLKDIIDTEGVDGFIAIENDVLMSINERHAIIATGGSAVYSAEAMEHFKKEDKIVYLKISYEDNVNRLGDIKGRGVVLKEGQTFRELYDERVILYERYADFTVDESGLSIEETVSAIAGFFSK